MRNKILVFILQGYEQKLDDGRLLDSVQIELIDKSYENALKRAKKIIKKPFYRLSMVVEKYEDK